MTKRSNQLLVMAVLSVQALSSCYPCDKNVCSSVDNITGNFRIKSADGKDLIFGPDKIYERSAIRFYALNGNDTSFYDSGSTRDVLGSTTDSLLFAKFEGYPDTAFMRLSDGDVDTIALEYLVSQNASCCVPRKDITRMYFNGRSESRGNVVEGRK